MTNLVLQITAIIYGFVVPKVIIDHFGSDVNGLISSIAQFLAYITLLESGFGPVVKATLYKPIAEKNHEAIAGILKTSERFFRKIALIFVLYIIILCFVFPIIAKADFDTFFTVSLVVIIGISTFAEYFFGMTYRLFLQAEQKTYIISIIQSATYILSTIAVALLAIFGANVVVIKLVAGLIFVIRPLAQNCYVKRKYKINLYGARKDYPIKQKWDGLAQHIAAVVHGNTDVTVLTIFTTLAEVSVYSVYYLVISGIKRIVQSFNNGLDASFGDMIAKNEVENLRKKFSIYETLFIMVVTIIFICTFLLITPFVKIYTSGVTDADYVRPVFGFLLTLSELVWSIRLPYSSITLAAGHFKETRRGAWVEAIVNIVLSVILVFNFGLIGVAIGTTVAMLIRTIEFVYHANKYILKRSVRTSAYKIVTAVVITVIFIVLANVVGIPSMDGYMQWGFYALILISGSVVVVIYSVFYREETVGIMRRIRKKRKKV